MSGRFDAKSHRYWITSNGVERPVPSVTQVLADLLPSHHASEWHLQRGRAVHACAALVAKGIEFEHDHRIAGQVEAVRRFLREVKPEIVEVEHPVYSALYGYAGTPDLVVRFGRLPIIVDYKSMITPTTIYQCAAYGLAHQPPITWGVGVALGDGRYTMSERWPLALAQSEWLAMLTTYHIRARLTLTNEETNENDHDHVV